MNKQFLPFAALILLLVAPAAAAQQWAKSYSAGQTVAGQYLGGTEILHLVPHKGRLYAGNSYWMESRRTLSVAGCQLLSKASPTAPWREEIEFPGSLRMNNLKQFIFTRDHNGNALARPDTVLLANPGNGDGRLIVYLRDDAANAWVKDSITTFTYAGADVSVRAAGMHYDAAANRQYIFLGLKTTGILRGVYDPGRPTKIAWTIVPELAVGQEFRVMGFTELNGTLYCGTSENGLARIYRRNDSASSPTWTQIWTDNQGSTNADLRGLSVVDKPTGAGQVLWFSWTGSARTLDPATGVAQVEFSYAPDLALRLGTPINGVLAAYNDNILSWYNPLRQATVQLIGFEARYAQPGPRPHVDRWTIDGLYYERAVAGGAVSYSLKNILQNGTPPTDTLLAVRTLCASPFAAEAGAVLYAGGYDANGVPASQTAWVYRGDFRLNPTATAPAASAANSLTAYPNPAQDRLTVSADQVLGEIGLYDALGRRQLTLLSDKKEATLDLSTLANGLYFIKAGSGGGSVRKLLIQR